MDYEIADFNGAAGVLAAGEPAARWAEIDQVLITSEVQLQASGQAGIIGRSIFDPKGTNRGLTHLAGLQGWHKVPLPLQLRMFGTDWDAGKGSVLAEWQFSNYPFLWNNVIRTEIARHGGIGLPGMAPISALIVVTKKGEFPSSNSTLYFEQARAQLVEALDHITLGIPIRLVGLALPAGATTIGAVLTQYGARYGRTGISTTRTFTVTRLRAVTYGVQPVTFS